MQVCLLEHGDEGIKMCARNGYWEWVNEKLFPYYKNAPLDAEIYELRLNELSWSISTNFRCLKCNKSNEMNAIFNNFGPQKVQFKP